MSPLGVYKSQRGNSFDCCHLNNPIPLSYHKFSNPNDSILHLSLLLTHHSAAAAAAAAAGIHLSPIASLTPSADFQPTHQSIRQYQAALALPPQAQQDNRLSNLDIYSATRLAIATHLYKQNPHKDQQPSPTNRKQTNNLPSHPPAPPPFQPYHSPSPPSQAPRPPTTLSPQP